MTVKECVGFAATDSKLMPASENPGLSWKMEEITIRTDGERWPFDMKRAAQMAAEG